MVAGSSMVPSFMVEMQTAVKLCAGILLVSMLQHVNVLYVITNLVGTCQNQMLKSKKSNLCEE